MEIASLCVELPFRELQTNRSDFCFVLFLFNRYLYLSLAHATWRSWWSGCILYHISPSLTYIFYNNIFHRHYWVITVKMGFTRHLKSNTVGKKMTQINDQSWFALWALLDLFSLWTGCLISWTVLLQWLWSFLLFVELTSCTFLM